MIRALAFALVAAAQAQQPSYVIRNVSVIAPSGTPATRVYDVVISGRHIVELVPPDSARAAGATVIDGRGLLEQSSRSAHAETFNKQEVAPTVNRAQRRTTVLSPL